MWAVFDVLWCPAMMALIVALVWVVEKLLDEPEDD